MQDSNEALVKRLQQGDETAAMELWGQGEGWAARVVRRYLPTAIRNGAVDLEDLMQTAFIGMLEAARAYDGERGGFLTVMQLYIRSECRALLGMRGRHPDRGRPSRRRGKGRRAFGASPERAGNRSSVSRYALL